MRRFFFQKLFTSFTRRIPQGVGGLPAVVQGVGVFAPITHNSYLITLLTCAALSAPAQPLQITNAATQPFTPDNLIRNMLLGDGVEVKSVTFKGKPVAVGYFTGGTQSVGIERGILMTTGAAERATANGNAQNDLKNGSTATDFDLNAIATSFLFDVAVYEIRFVPTADTLRFRYCFASEEYPEFACKNFNDVFAFFIQGPGYPTPTNIARIPGTGQVVSINTLHPTYAPNNCPAANVQFYNSNLNAAQQPIYDGFTDVFTAQAIVTPCQEYTIKLAIGDVGDDIFDSGVFLEAKSFGTGSLQVALNTLSADGSIAEGCAPGTLTFSIPKPISKAFPIDFKLGGTAAQGVDYQNFPATLSIPAGQTSITVPVAALVDNLPETGEFIALDVQRDPCNRDTLLIFLRDNGMVPPSLPPDTTYCIGNAQPLLLDGTLPLPTPPAPTFTNTTDFAVPDDDNLGTASPITVFGVQPTALGPGVIRSVCLNATHPWVDDLDLYLVSPGGQVLELSTDNGQNGQNYTQTCFTPNATTAINFPGPAAPASAAPFTGDWLPEGPWADLWDGQNPSNGIWKLQATDDQITFAGSLLDWSITFEPSYKINYAWSPAAGLDCADCPIVTATPTQPMVYTLTASDSYGCSASDQIAITPQTELAAPAVTCAGETSTTLTFGWPAVGGATGYEVNLNGTGWVPANGNLTHTATAVLPGTTLSIQVRGISNAPDCPALIGTATCTKCANPTLGIAQIEPGCNGAATGSITVSILSNPNPPYTYTLGIQSNTSGIFQNLTAGLYPVTATDTKGCSGTATVLLLDPPALQATVSTTAATCFSGKNGTATATPTGGTAPHQFLWNTGSTAPQITGLAAGAYTVTVTDAKNCTATASGSVAQPAPLAAQATPYAVGCFGEKTGRLRATVSGGAPGYTLSWSGPAGFTVQGDTLSQLAAGLYTATATDAAGCTLVFSENISQPASGLTLALPQPADSVCFGGKNGAATVTASGSTTPYTYLWDAAGQITATATALAAAAYRVTVTDARGCTATAATSVVEKPPLTATATAQDPRCYNGSDGTATVSAAAYGIAPADLAAMQFLWNTVPPQTARTAIGLKANSTYTVTLSDADGCTATASISTGNPAAFLAEAKPLSPAPCFGEPGGSAIASGTGGQPPYTYAWSAGGGSAAQASGLLAGAYRVTLTDALGCSATASVSIGQPTALKISTFSAPAKCFGENSGTAKAAASGGTPPYNYLWAVNGAQQKPDIKDLYAGHYFVSVTDANGCRALDSVEVGQPALLGGTAQVSDATCFGLHNGKVQLAGSGGTPPYRYALDKEPWNGSSLQFGLEAGTYVPKIQDSKGCTAALPSVTVAQRPAIVVDLGPDIEVDLGKNTQIFATVSHALKPFRFSWPIADSLWLSCLDCSAPFVDSLLHGRYFSVRVTDTMGCTGSDQIFVAVKKERRVYVPTGFSPNGDNQNDRLWPVGQEGVQVLDFQVFDRWGELVFQSKNFALNDPDAGWDGTFRGQDAAPGVYVWMMEVEYRDGARERMRGETVLVR